MQESNLSYAGENRILYGVIHNVLFADFLWYNLNENKIRK